MKQFILNLMVFGVTILLYNCSPQPSPQPSTPTTPSNPSTPTSTMSAGEAALKGKWYYKRRDIDATTSIYNNPNYYIKFDSTLITDNSGTISRTGYRYTDSNTGVAGYTTWVTNTTGDTLIMQSPSQGTINDIKYKVALVTSDSLILELYGTGCLCTFKYYFHK